VDVVVSYHSTKESQEDWVRNNHLTIQRQLAIYHKRIFISLLMFS